MAEKSRKISPAKIILMLALRVIEIALALAVLLVAFLSLTEYRPEDKEPAAIEGGAAGVLKKGDEIGVVSWNIGYGALGETADFFMDGGTMVKTADKAGVEANMEGIKSALKDLDPDVIFIQEVDISSARSSRVNEYLMLQQAFPDMTSSFAANFRTAFVPYPIPPMGKVDAGIAVFSSFEPSYAERVQLPVPFSWPVRAVNLKRCLLINRIPVEGGGELVLVNLHLEAYDDGEGKAAQTAMLAEILRSEAGKGNYVIAGGDFNQIFSSADGSAYPSLTGEWVPGVIDVESFGEGWQFLMDDSLPSCRSLSMPYAGADKESFQYYLIDGFIVSENIEVSSLNTVDLGFVFSDHQPVLLNAVLK
ncbi:MAG: endonuclease/exonuclease/phosphatase family protein [Firmicutes bacterium]|nr:endonuclease/exonuclease/phosphatase family protein [Bacillota bacterium]